MAARQASTTTTEFVLKLADIEDQKMNIMRFMPPHKCDIEKLHSPSLERQESKRDEGVPEYGEGSEFNKKHKDEVRQKKRGYRPRKVHPDDQPWVLKEQKKGGKQFIGRKEGGVNTSASYYMLACGVDGNFEAYPIQNWYDFQPPIKYDFLNDEEAEERFEKRNKTLNYFSIMVSKRIKDQEGDSDVESKGKKKRNVDSDDDEDFISGSDDEKTSSKRKKLLKNSSKRSKKQQDDSESEAGEDTDEGDVESQEMDYFSSSSESENEEKSKVREQPRDDAEVERKEAKEIDKIFEESSSEESDEENLTETGKQLKELIDKQQQHHSHPLDDEDEFGDEDDEEEEEKIRKTPEKSKSKSKSPQKSVPRSKRENESPESNSGGPPTKKSRAESPSTITPDEVRKYLQRKPMTSSSLVKKFKKQKTGMEKQAIVTVLGTILKGMSQIKKQAVNGKMYLSIQSDSEKE